MNIDSIGASPSGATTQPGGRSLAAQDFAALDQALQQGDLTGAQQAFATLQQDVPWVGRAVTGQSTQGPNGPGPLTSALQALGGALKSGDVAAAQKAFAALAQAHGGHHGHRHATKEAAPADAAPAAATTPAAATSTTGSLVDTRA